MAREHGGPSSLDTVCARGGQHDTGVDRPPIDPVTEQVEQVHWAGLPVNLDMVFSQQQRDKVYAQHLMRTRGARLWQWLQDGA